MRRHSADERRRLVIEAASQEFAAFGLYGATGEGISYRAGISHPYLLRLFGSKKDLFRAVIDSAFHDLEAAVAEGVNGGTPNPSAAAVEQAIQQTLDQGQRSALLLQFIAACGDDEVRPIVRRRLAELYDQLARLSGTDEAELRALFARVILGSATAAMRLPEIASREPWARRLLEP